jgi:drug/metabolite transporter (DMT)-like permease
MLYGAVFTGLIALGQGNEFNFHWSVGYVGSLLYLAVFGSIVAFGSYLTLLGRIGASRAGYAVVMFPVVALVVSFAFEGLALTANIVLGIVLVMAGNVLILRRDRAAPGRPVSPVRDYGNPPVPDSP